MSQTETAEFTITRVFDAPRELVWRLWTTEADAAEWWHPRGIEIKPGSVRLDARVGGDYAYTMVNPETGDEYPTNGVYREITPPERLVFTWGGPGDTDDEHAVITVELSEVEDDPDRTEMRFHVLGFEGRPGDGDIYDGWDSAFDLLGEQLGDAR